MEFKSQIATTREQSEQLLALGLKPDEAVVIGDSYDKDIVPARQAGCHAVWLKGEGWSEKAYDESLPDAVITELKQVLNIKRLLRSK